MYLVQVYAFNTQACQASLQGSQQGAFPYSPGPGEELGGDQHGLVGLLEKTAKARVAFVTRFGEGLLPVEDTVIQDGDIVHVVMRDTDAEAVEQAFRSRPEDS